MPYVTPAIPRPLLYVSLWGGLIGFPVSLYVHVTTYYSHDFSAAALHILAMAAAAPVLVWMFRWAEEQGFNMQTLGGQWRMVKAIWGSLSGWQKVLLCLSLVYTMVNFVAGMAATLTRPEAELFPTRMFSGHWMYFFLFSALLAHVFLTVPPAIPDEASGETERLRERQSEALPRSEQR